MQKNDLLRFMIERARTNFAVFVTAVYKPVYFHSAFSVEVCKAVDKFVDELLAGKRPVLMLCSPPQHGKSALISKCLPAYLLGRLSAELPTVRVACASYALSLAKRNLRDAKSVIFEPIYREIFPHADPQGFNGTNTTDELHTPVGALRGVGAGGSLTGFSADCAILDDCTKDAQEALSTVVQDGLEAWFDSVVTTRLQERSGLVVIGTSWSSNDILARIARKYKDTPRFTRLSFPALNLPDEIGYRDDLPQGALVPALQPLEKLLEVKATISSFWWAALYQQVPYAEFGAIFKTDHVQHYRRAELPKNFERTVLTVDAAFKNGTASDYVAIGVWGKSGPDAYLLDWRRERLSFTSTATAISDLAAKYPAHSRIYIEDAANGPALIDMLSAKFSKIEGVPPLGSKEARAYAVSWVWENNNVWLPDPTERPAIATVVSEITTFPDSATGHDDLVDMMTIALHQLYVRPNLAALISQKSIRGARR